MSHLSKSGFAAHFDDLDALTSLKDLEIRLRGFGTNPDFQSNSLQKSSSQHESSESSNSCKLRDLTNMAVWMVSTAKPGNGIEQILDGDHQTYWQSDGPQPHYISAQFMSKLKISEIQIYLSLAIDESYTPSVISIRAGSNFHDLRTVKSRKKLKNPHGWIRIPLGEDVEDSDDEIDDESDTEPNMELSPEEQSARNARRAEKMNEIVKIKAQKKKEIEEARRVALNGVNGHLEGLRNREVIKAHMIQIIIHANHHKGRDSHVRMVKVLGPKQQVVGASSTFTTKEFQMHETIR